MYSILSSVTKNTRSVNVLRWYQQWFDDKPLFRITFLTEHPMALVWDNCEYLLFGHWTATYFPLHGLLPIYLNKIYLPLNYNSYRWHCFKNILRPNISIFADLHYRLSSTNALVLRPRHILFLSDLSIHLFKSRKCPLNESRTDNLEPYLMLTSKLI